MTSGESPAALSCILQVILTVSYHYLQLLTYCMLFMMCGVWGIICSTVFCRFIRDDAVEAEAVRQREAEAAAERQRVAASVSRTLTKQVSYA